MASISGSGDCEASLSVCKDALKDENDQEMIREEKGDDSERMDMKDEKNTPDPEIEADRGASGNQKAETETPKDSQDMTGPVNDDQTTETNELPYPQGLDEEVAVCETAVADKAGQKESTSETLGTEKQTDSELQQSCQITESQTKEEVCEVELTKWGETEEEAVVSGTSVEGKSSAETEQDNKTETREKEDSKSVSDKDMDGVESEDKISEPSAVQVTDREEPESAQTDNIADTANIDPQPEQKDLSDCQTAQGTTESDLVEQNSAIVSESESVRSASLASEEKEKGGQGDQPDETAEVADLVEENKSASQGGTGQGSSPADSSEKVLVSNSEDKSCVIQSETDVDIDSKRGVTPSSDSSELSGKSVKGVEAEDQEMDSDVVSMDYSNTAQDMETDDIASSDTNKPEQDTGEAKVSYASEFEKFLHSAQAEPKPALKKASVEPEKEFELPLSKVGESNPRKHKLFDFEESNASSSSWYKPKKNGASSMEAMSVDSSSTLDTDRGLPRSRLLPPDETSNLSMPESLASGLAEGSVISSNIEDSCMSFPEDISNLSNPDDNSNLSATDSNMVPTFGQKPDLSLLDESANLNAPSDKCFQRPDTPSSTMTDAESTPLKKPRRGTLAIAAEEASEHRHDLTAAELFEYQWPQESGAEWFMLQEQVCLFLNVKSFKRKYPELFRRVCDKTEKDFLREKCVVSETQSDLGLTAVKSDEIHELMSKDYTEKYQEYMHVLHEKERQNISNKHKDYDVPKLEKGKMKEYTKKAMKSVLEWNQQLQRERKEERRAYFDMQTFTIHYPQNRFKKLPPESTAVTSYPVALIPGQFQEHCRRYTPEELKYFPLNTAMFDPPKKMNHLEKQVTPEPDSEDQEEEVAKQTSVSASGSESEEDSSSNSDVSSVAEETAEPVLATVKVEEKVAPVEPKEDLKCRICSDSKEKKRKPKKGEDLVQCSECKGGGHPSCLDLTGEMVDVIRTYPWQCMECKTCVECMDPYDEDKMMFCDRCDRGYHTFCVGLKSLPTGRWECVSCKTDTTSSQQKSTPQRSTPRSTTKAKRGRKANGK